MGTSGVGRRNFKETLWRRSIQSSKCFDQKLCLQTCLLIIPLFFSASEPSSICANGGNSSPSRRDARDMVLSSLPPFCIAQHQEASEHETGIPREGAPHSLPPKSPFFCTSFLFFRAVEWIQVARFNLRRRVRDEGKKRKVSEYRIYPPLTLSKC